MRNVPLWIVALWTACWGGPAGRAAAGEGAAAAAWPPRHREEIRASCSPQQMLTWPEVRLEGKVFRASACMEQPRGYEVNHHRLTVRYSGSGSVELSVAHSTTNDLKEALTKAALHSRPAKRASGATLTVRSSLPRERCAWLLIRTEGPVTVESIDYVFWRGRQTVYGHLPTTYEFGGAKLPYRIMWPRKLEAGKRYPLVISVAGSGSVGSDNIRNMERVILARHLFYQYYHDDELACFSLVPQIPHEKSIPAPYWPKGPRGAPTPVYHPDWPAVNENGWYAQATVALIRRLLRDGKYPIDPDRVYFTGFSYGGKACWEMLKADRALWAAAFCGAGWPIGGAYANPVGPLLERLKLEVQRYRHVPVLAFAGQRDRMSYGSSAVCREIRARGGKARFVQIAGASHIGAAARGWSDRKHVAWLFAQNRKANPKPGADPFPGGVYPAGPR